MTEKTSLTFETENENDSCLENILPAGDSPIELSK
jgi:hypothetical protein